MFTASESEWTLGEVFRKSMRHRASTLGACLALLSLSSAPLAAQELNWERKSPTSSPTGPSSPAMAYDAARAQVVLFGGMRRKPYRDGNRRWG